MANVTYHNQPAIHKVRGSIPLAGTSDIYKVYKVLWRDPVEKAIATMIISPCLHICCGMSKLGDIRLDLDIATNPNLLADAAQLPFADGQFESVLCDPPYNGKFQWNHDMLKELGRVTRTRIIFQHWYLPCNNKGEFKKYNKFKLKQLWAWQPMTYFGRCQLVSIFDVES
jgi:hypothetical protein